MRSLTLIGGSGSLLFALTCCSSKDAAAPATAPNNTQDAGTNPNTDDEGGAPDAAPAADPYATAVTNATWLKLATAPSVSGGQKMDDVFFTSADIGYAANGPGGSIIKTSDGGATWSDSFKHAGTYFRAVAFVDAQHGFAGNLGAGLSASITDTTVLYETKDAGATWNPVTTITGDAPSGICNLTVIDATHLVGVGRANGPAHYITSSDGGATWTSKDLGTQASMLIDAHFTSPTEGIVVGMGAKNPVCTVLRTTDGSTFTTVFESKTTNSLCWKVSFPSDKVGYVAVQDAAGGPPTFAKTTDGGSTWTESKLAAVKTNATGGFPAIGIGFITENIGWVAPEDETLPTYRTIDGGLTWTVDTALKSPINRFRFFDKNTAYAIGGTIWKLTVPAQ